MVLSSLHDALGWWGSGRSAAVGRLGAISIRVCELICKHLFADVGGAASSF
jgi:hypothetical protein